MNRDDDSCLGSTLSCRALFFVRSYATTSSSVASSPGVSTARKSSVLPVVYAVSQTEIGRRLGLPQRKVSRIIAASVKSLKERISSRE